MSVQPIKSKKDIELMKKVLADNPRNLLLFKIGINSALRISDLLRLRVRDLTGDYIELTEVKTRKGKRIKINEAIRKAADELIPKDARPSDWLFPSRKGDKPISRVQAWRILSGAADYAGVNARVGCHSLRKSFAYHAYMRGVELPLLMSVLNHSSERETLRYIGIEAEQIDDVYIDVCL